MDGNRSATVIDLAKERVTRRIRESIRAATARGDAPGARERRVRSAAFEFACNAPAERHARLALYEQFCAPDADGCDPAAVARIVLALPANVTPGPADYRAVFGIPTPNSEDALCFIVEAGGDIYCRHHGLPFEA